MKKPQWITVTAGLILVVVIYFFGKTVPAKKTLSPSAQTGQDNLFAINTDSILAMAKKHLTAEQVVRLNELEHSISRGDVKQQQLKVFHQLAHFWGDTAAIFEPYAWYEAEAARLENSEKSLTFAARLFLDNLQGDELPERKRWKALQAKELFEGALKLNPANDSARIGLGACYLFGDISASPMEGISMIRSVVGKDSNNVYGQLMLAKGSVISGQYDKAVTRLQTVNRLLEETNGDQGARVEAVLLLADVYERMGDKANAVNWYEKSLQFIRRQDVRNDIEKRMKELKASH